MFLYGVMVMISAALPAQSRFYSCKTVGKVIAYRESNSEDAYLVKYEGCKYPEDSPQSGYDRDWYPASYLKQIRVGDLKEVK